MSAIVSNFDNVDFDFSSAIQPQWLDTTAIEFGESKLSYRDLRKAVEARAKTLSAAICKGQIVALEMSKSPITWSIFSPFCPPVPSSRRSIPRCRNRVGA